MSNKSPKSSLKRLDESPLSMDYPSGNTKFPDKGVVIAADVGGTKTNLSIYRIEKSILAPLKEHVYATADFESFSDMVLDFRKGSKEDIDGLCVGVAGNVIQGRVRGTNFPWEMEVRKIADELQLKSVAIINDLVANAYGLSALKAKDFHTLLEGGSPAIAGNAAIISPGTGLGEAGLYWDGTRYHPYATEGGHCGFSPRDDLDAALWSYLHRAFGHVSWERVLSGQGIHNIYKFLREFRKEKEPQWLTDEISANDPPVVITDAAIQKKDSISIQTLDLFIKYLAVEAAQLGLKSKSLGGIFIGGGIVPKIINSINKDDFFKHFVDVGRLSDLLENVPVHVVLNDKAAVLGAAHYAAMSLAGHKDQ